MVAPVQGIPTHADKAAQRASAVTAAPDASARRIEIASANAMIKGRAPNDSALVAVAEEGTMNSKKEGLRGDWIHAKEDSIVTRANDSPGMSLKERRATDSSLRAPEAHSQALERLSGILH